MNTQTRFVLAWLSLAVTITAAAIAAGGSVQGVVTDSSGAPLAKVKVTLSGQDFKFEKETTTSKKGEFRISVSDAGQGFLVRVEKEGYRTQQEPLKIPSGQVMDVTWVLLTDAEAAQQGEQLQALQAKDKATKAYNRGAEAYNANDVEIAVASFREAVETNPNLELAHAALGRILLENKRWVEARAAGEAFVKVSPDEPLALQTLYDSYWGEAAETDNEEEAKALKAKADEVLESMLKQDSGEAVAARIFNQGVAATKLHDYESAASSFAKALELDPSLYQALLPLAQIHYSKGEWQAAIDMAEEYLGHDAKNARANIVRYVSYQELGNKEAADNAFAELGENSPKAAAEMFLRDGINFFNDGEIAKAIEAVERSVDLEADNPRAHHQLGLCYASAGENGKAKVAFEKFLELAPDDSEAATVRDMLTYLN